MQTQGHVDGVVDPSKGWSQDCRDRARRALRDAHPTLRASALLALAKLMCLDAAFCEANLQLLFTLLHTRCAPP